MNNFTLSLIKNKVFLESDIVHLHLVHNTSFDINYLPFITEIKPVLITLHDPFFLGGHCIHHFNCDKWQTHCCDCQYLDIPFPIEADDTALRFGIKKTAIQNSDISVIVTSDWMGSKIECSPIWKQKNIYKLPFGIDQKIFNQNNIKEARKRLDIKEDAVVLMFRATNNPYKGLELIKKSLNNLKYDKEIVLITVQDTGLLDDFKERFTIKEYGWITDCSFLAELYQACDLFLMPSEQESFGLMAVEAMICGKTVLTTNKTALKTIVNSPNCGIAVEHNVDCYAEELQRLVINVEERDWRGKKSMEFAKNNYDIKVFIPNLVNIYNDIIKRHNSKYTLEEEKLIIGQMIKYNDDYKKELIKQTSREKKKKNRITRIFGRFVPNSIKAFLKNLSK